MADSGTIMINIVESAKESIQQAFAIGKVDRGLFYEAMMAIFPNLVFCWKNQKVKKAIVGDNAEKEDSTALPDYLHRFNSDWYQKVQTTMSMTDFHHRRCPIDTESLPVPFSELLTEKEAQC
ncbi:unnamed protein product [Coregonus sp. 'balchen']|nr:unnamed protein product [Coregonus sp. 'balchen']